MKKSELKTEIRNRILEKKSKVEENTEFSDIDLDSKDAALKNLVSIYSNRGEPQQIQAIFDIIEQLLKDFKAINLDNFKSRLNAWIPTLKANNTQPEPEEEEEKDEVEEISTSAGSGAYQTKYAFKLPKDYKKAKEVNEGIIEPKSKKKA